MRAAGKQVGGMHYETMAIQPWDAAEAWMTPEQFQGYLWGEIIGYIARWPVKGGKQDLEKAAHTLNRLLETFHE